MVRNSSPGYSIITFQSNSAARPGELDMHSMNIVHLAVVLGCTRAPALAGATGYVNDPLTDASAPGLGLRDGSFSASG